MERYIPRTNDARRNELYIKLHKAGSTIDNQKVKMLSDKKRKEIVIEEVTLTIPNGETVL